MANDARERILRACEQTIAASGLRGFRMQDVAREAGVSIGLLAYHFGDRDGLLQAALDHVNASAAARARQQPGGSGTGERLSALLCSEFGDEAQTRAGSIAWNELRAAAVFEPAFAQALARSTGDWQRATSELVAAANPHLDADDTALMLTALVEGLSGRWLTGQITAERAWSTIRRTLAALDLLPAEA